MKHLSYDKEYDILAIHKGFTKDEKFKGNMNAEQLILDISTKGRIKGVEILDAAEFFKDFKIDKNTFENLVDAKINPNGVILGINVLAKEKEIPAKVAVPLPAR
ncbi:DUF2283 domain-containing protein [Candidatus Woesearchaeota archaeon]|nr:DUF2283 domain-containing protein [Candidatus Woesearchaeota archaeon]